MPYAMSTSDQIINFAFRSTNQMGGTLLAVQSGLNSLTAVAGSVGRGLSDAMSLTQSAALAIGTISVMAFGQAVNAAGEYEAKMAQVQAISGQSAAEVAQLGNSAQQLSVKYGMSLDNVTNGLITLGRAGINNAATQSGVLEEGFKMAKLEGIDLNTALEDLITTTNLLSQTNVDMNSPEYITQVKEMNTKLLTASQVAPIDVNDVIESLQYSGGSAAASHMDTDNLLATISAMGARGTKGSLAGTALRNFMTRDITSTGKNALESIGITPDDFWKAGGNQMRNISELKQIIDERMQTLGMSRQEQLSFWSKFAGQKMANQLMKIDPSEVEKYQEQIEKGADVENEMNTILTSTKELWNEITAAGENFVVNVGSKILAVVNPIFQVVKGIVSGIGSIPYLNDILGVLGAGGLLVGVSAGAMALFNVLGPSIASLVRRFREGESWTSKIKNEVLSIKDTWNAMKNPAAFQEGAISLNDAERQQILQEAARRRYGQYGYPQTIQDKMWAKDDAISKGHAVKEMFYVPIEERDKNKHYVKPTDELISMIIGEKYESSKDLVSIGSNKNNLNTKNQPPSGTNEAEDRANRNDRVKNINDNLIKIVSNMSDFMKTCNDGINGISTSITDNISISNGHLKEIEAKLTSISKVGEKISTANKYLNNINEKIKKLTTTLDKINKREDTTNNDQKAEMVITPNSDKTNITVGINFNKEEINNLKKQIGKLEIVPKIKINEKDFQSQVNSLKLKTNVILNTDKNDIEKKIENINSNVVLNIKNLKEIEHITITPKINIKYLQEELSKASMSVESKGNNINPIDSKSMSSGIKEGIASSIDNISTSIYNGIKKSEIELIDIIKKGINAHISDKNRIESQARQRIIEERNGREGLAGLREELSSNNTNTNVNDGSIENLIQQNRTAKGSLNPQNNNELVTEAHTVIPNSDEDTFYNKEKTVREKRAEERERQRREENRLNSLSMALVVAEQKEQQRQLLLSQNNQNQNNQNQNEPEPIFNKMYGRDLRNAHVQKTKLYEDDPQGLNYELLNQERKQERKLSQNTTSKFANFSGEGSALSYVNHKFAQNKNTQIGESDFVKHLTSPFDIDFGFMTNNQTPLAQIPRPSSVEARFADFNKIDLQEYMNRSVFPKSLGRFVDTPSPPTHSSNASYVYEDGRMKKIIHPNESDTLINDNTVPSALKFNIPFKSDIGNGMQSLDSLATHPIDENIQFPYTDFFYNLLQRFEDKRRKELKQVAINKDKRRKELKQVAINKIKNSRKENPSVLKFSIPFKSAIGSGMKSLDSLATYPIDESIQFPYTVGAGMNSLPSYQPRIKVVNDISKYKEIGRHRYYQEQHQKAIDVASMTSHAEPRDYISPQERRKLNIRTSNTLTSLWTEGLGAYMSSPTGTERVLNNVLDARLRASSSPNVKEIRESEDRIKLFKNKMKKQLEAKLALERKKINLIKSEELEIQNRINMLGYGNTKQFTLQKPQLALPAPMPQNMTVLSPPQEGSNFHYLDTRTKEEIGKEISQGVKWAFDNNINLNKFASNKKSPMRVYQISEAPQPVTTNNIVAGATPNLPTVPITSSSWFNDSEVNNLENIKHKLQRANITNTNKLGHISGDTLTRLNTESYRTNTNIVSDDIFGPVLPIQSKEPIIPNNINTATQHRKENEDNRKRQQRLSNIENSTNESSILDYIQWKQEQKDIKEQDINNQINTTMGYNVNDYQAYIDMAQNLPDENGVLYGSKDKTIQGGQLVTPQYSSTIDIINEKNQKQIDRDKRQKERKERRARQEAREKEIHDKGYKLPKDGGTKASRFAHNYVKSMENGFKRIKKMNFKSIEKSFKKIQKLGAKAFNKVTNGLMNVAMVAAPQFADQIFLLQAGMELAGGVMEVLNLLRDEEIMEIIMTDIAVGALTVELGALILPIIAVIAVVALLVKSFDDSAKKNKENADKFSKQYDKHFEKYNYYKKQLKSTTTAHDEYAAKMKQEESMMKAASSQYAYYSNKVAEDNSNDVLGQYGVRGQAIAAFGMYDFSDLDKETADTSGSIRSVKQEGLGNQFWNDLFPQIAGPASAVYETIDPTAGYQKDIQNYYDKNEKDFNLMDQYKQPLSTLFNVETGLLPKYGNSKEAVRASKEYQDAMKLVTDKTHMTSEQVEDYLDWMEGNQVVQQTKQNMQSTTDQHMNAVRATVDAAWTGEPIDTSRLKGMTEIQKKMITYEATKIAKEEWKELIMAKILLNIKKGVDWIHLICTALKDIPGTIAGTNKDFNKGWKTIQGDYKALEAIDNTPGYSDNPFEAIPNMAQANVNMAGDYVRTELASGDSYEAAKSETESKESAPGVTPGGLANLKAKETAAASTQNSVGAGATSAGAAAATNSAGAGATSSGASSKSKDSKASKPKKPKTPIEYIKTDVSKIRLSAARIANSITGVAAPLGFVANQFLPKKLPNSKVSNPKHAGAKMVLTRGSINNAGNRIDPLSRINTNVGKIRISEARLANYLVPKNQKNNPIKQLITNTYKIRVSASRIADVVAPVKGKGKGKGKDNKPKGGGATIEISGDWYVNTTGDPDDLKSQMMQIFEEISDRINPKVVSQISGTPPASSSSSTTTDSSTTNNANSNTATTTDGSNSGTSSSGKDSSKK
jgi:TP901 family phage tail tape measure protein